MEEIKEETLGSTDNGLHPKLVAMYESGEGLPYAPSDWPNPGDKWGWKVGKRVSINGFFIDRYLYLPKRLRDSEPETRKRAFASKLAVARYVAAKFPKASVEAFFASFKWKIPAKGCPLANGHVKMKNLLVLPTDEEMEQSVIDSDGGGCKAGNKTCSSLVEQVEDSPNMDCDICCIEPRFCRDCCCILCCKSVNSTYGGYSYVKCEAVVEDGRLCSHITHINCALRSYMAGKVGGTIGLDAEYYCRRCDAKTDLLPHVTKLFQTCESVESRDDIKKILKVGISVLHGSERTKAKELLSRIELAMSKLDSGACLEDVWKVDGDSSTPSTDITQQENAAMDIDNSQDPLDTRTDSQNMSSAYDWLTESLKLQDEVDRILRELKKSQEIEYKLAEEKLYDQKHYLSSLYQQLEIEKSELANHTSSSDRDYLLNAVSNREEQIKQELAKFKDMEKVACGFGKTSRDVLEEHFGLNLDD